VIKVWEYPNIVIMFARTLTTKKGKKMEIEVIKNKLRYGDVPKIATLARCSAEMVRNILIEETRNQDTALAQKIIQTASIFIVSREKLEEESEALQNLYN